MRVNKFLLRVTPLYLALVMSGCSIYSLPGSEPRQPEPPPAPAAPTPAPPPAPQPPRPPQPSTSSAWKPLVAKAQQARSRGDYEQALALLERAQRIDPESAQIYLQLAQTHAARGDTAQARATAERGLLFCSVTAQCDALRSYTR